MNETLILKEFNLKSTKTIVHEYILRTYYVGMRVHRAPY